MAANIPIVIATDLLRKINPIFDFYIPETDFFVNIPSISITEGNKSISLIQDGKINLINKNNTPTYFKQIYLDINFTSILIYFQL